VSTRQVRDPLRAALTGGVRSDAETIVQPAELPALLGPTVPIERLGAGAMLGTPGCMAPVRALGHAGDHRANPFAVAVIRFEIQVSIPFSTPSSWRKTNGPMIAIRTVVALRADPARSCRPDNLRAGRLG
jgi:hypothetical protein